MSSEQSETTHSAASSASAISKSNTAAATSGSAAALTAREEFVIDCIKNARYHEDRERFFAWIHKGAMFIVVVSGTASFASVKAQPMWGGIIAVTGLLDLVFDISGRARLHASLRRRFYDLLAQSEVPTITDGGLREQAARIYGDEPPCMHAANYIAFNGAMEAYHRPREYLYKIRWYHHLLRHICPFASSQPLSSIPGNSASAPVGDSSYSAAAAAPVAANGNSASGGYDRNVNIFVQNQVQADSFIRSRAQIARAISG